MKGVEPEEQTLNEDGGLWEQSNLEEEEDGWSEKMESEASSVAIVATTRRPGV